MEKIKRSVFKRILNTAGNILLGFFLVICIFTLLLTLTAKKDIDGTAEIFGYQLRIVTSSSMEASEYTDVSAYDIKSIPIRSMVFVKLAPDDEAERQKWYDSLEVGDVLTFRYVYTTQVTITHRITDKVPNGEGGYIIYLEGDNKTDDNGQLSQEINTSEVNVANYIIGKVTGKSYLFGVGLSLLKSKLGIILLIMLPCVFIISFEVAKIIKTVSSDRKKRNEEEIAKKDDELAELRRQLELLQKQSNAENNKAAKSEDAEGEDK